MKNFIFLFLMLGILPRAAQGTLIPSRPNVLTRALTYLPNPYAGHSLVNASKKLQTLFLSSPAWSVQYNSRTSFSLCYEGKEIFSNLPVEQILQLFPNGALPCKELTFTMVDCLDTGNFVGYFKNVEIVSFTSTCNQIGAGVAYLTQLPNLKKLNFNQVGQTNLVALARLKTLKSLTFFKCAHLDDTEFMTLAELPNLESLEILDCPNATDDGIELLKDLENLKELKLQSCPCITKSPVNFVSLESLDLIYCNNFDDQALQRLSVLPKLKKIIITKCAKITNKGVAILQELRPDFIIHYNC